MVGHASHHACCCLHARACREEPAVPFSCWGTYVPTSLRTRTSATSNVGWLLRSTTWLPRTWYVMKYKATEAYEARTACCLRPSRKPAKRWGSPVRTSGCWKVLCQISWKAVDFSCILMSLCYRNSVTWTVDRAVEVFRFFTYCYCSHIVSYCSYKALFMLVVISASFTLQEVAGL